jgi:hypothetical protein
MSKRSYEGSFITSNKRVHVCRKRSRDREEYTPRKRTCFENEIFQEATEAYQTIPNQLDMHSLRETNKLLRFHLGKIARLGISLKMERDVLKREVAYLLQMQKSHVMTHPQITVP